MPWTMDETSDCGDHRSHERRADVASGKSLGGQRLRKVHHGGAAARSGKGGDSCAVAEKNVPPRRKITEWRSMDILLYNIAATIQNWVRFSLRRRRSSCRPSRLELSHLWLDKHCGCGTRREILQSWERAEEVSVTKSAAGAV